MVRVHSRFSIPWTVIMLSPAGEPSSPRHLWKLTWRPLGVALSLLLLAGCAVTPSVTSWRPWSRTLSGFPPVPGPPATFEIEVTGSNPALLGDQRPAARVLESQIVDLLSRRGYVRSTQDPDFSLRVEYRTVAHGSATTRSRRMSRYDFRRTTTSAYGVQIASTVSQARSLASATTRSTTRSVYLHTMTIGLPAADEATLWQTDIQWTGREPDILPRSRTALQFVFSRFPRSDDSRPTVRKVRSDRLENFLEIYCEGTWFSCPATPYRIRFPMRSGAGSGTEIDASVIQDPASLAAAVDLIQTAEFAFPLGETEWGDPLAPDLWTKVAIGGTYALAPSGETAHVIVTMVGERAGYEIESVRRVSGSEFADYEDALARWRSRLVDYYDVFED